MTTGLQLDVRLPAEIDGAVELQLRWNQPMADAARAALQELVDGFCMLADLGAYVATSRSPRHSRCRIASRSIAPQAATWSLDVSATDSRCARVLLNALRAFGRLHHPLAGLRLHAPGPPLGEPLEPSLNGMAPDRAYPPLSRDLRMEVEIGPGGRAKHGRRVEITFQQRLGPATLVRVCAVLRQWAAVSFMAYPATDDAALSGECAIADVSCQLATAYAIEMELGHFGAAEAAWHSLLNLCQRLNDETQAMARVEVQ